MLDNDIEPRTAIGLLLLLDAGLHPTGTVNHVHFHMDLRFGGDGATQGTQLPRREHRLPLSGDDGYFARQGEAAFTPFLREADKRGLKWQSGLSMLVNQAALNITMWTGLDPDKEVMKKALEEALS